MDSSGHCRYCGSINHATDSHHRLERAIQDFEKWEIGSPDSTGTDGEPLRLTSVSGPPDLVRIVPCIIGADGSRLPFRAAAILRLWSQDDLEGFIFMLSFDRLNQEDLESVEAVCGAPGSPATVEIKFSPTTQPEALATTSASI